MRTEPLVTTAEDGRRVVVWRSRGADGIDGRDAAVLAPGFGRDMRQLGTAALYLVANGFTCYRFDALDHVGLSDGDIRSYTATAHALSLAATVDLAAAEGCRRLVVVAVSLAGRVAVRMGRSDPRIDGVLGVVGVVNGRRTLAHALGEDLVARPFGELPARVRFEGHEIDPRPLWLDNVEHDWGSLEGTVDDLKRCPQLVTNFVGTADSWVDLGEVHEAFTRGDGGPRRIFEMPFGEHELSTNPVALQVLLGRLTETALQVGEPDAAPLVSQHVDLADAAAPIAEPSFDDLITVTLAERELARASAAENPT